MTGSDFRGIGDAFVAMIPLAIIGLVAILAGAVWLLWWLFHHVRIV